MSGCILVAVGVQLMPPNLQTHFAPPKPLAEWLTPSVAGWVSKDEAIANTPEMKAKVGELLNYTDSVFRIYQKGGRQLAVYLAYWRPGQMDPRLVAAHSPDVCWAETGWKHAAPAAEWRVEVSDVHTLGSGQLREFDNQGQTQHVVFWHFVGGRPSGLVERYVRGQSFWTWDQIIKNPRAPKYEQWFVRISSNEPLDQLAGDPLWEALITQLAPIASIQQPTGR